MHAYIHTYIHMLYGSNKWNGNKKLSNTIYPSHFHIIFVKQVRCKEVAAKNLTKKNMKSTLCYFLTII